MINLLLCIVTALVLPRLIVSKQCPMEIWVYESESDCKNDFQNPGAKAQLYADNTCRTNDVLDSSSSQLESYLPGTYSMQCVDGGGQRVAFFNSGCTSSDCSSSSGSGLCDQESTLASLYASVDPSYKIVDPSNQAQSGYYSCFTLSSSSGGSFTFAIFGNCSDSSCSLDSTTAPTKNPTPPPATAPPTKSTPAPTSPSTRPPTSPPTPPPTPPPTSPSTSPPTSPSTSPPTSPSTPRPTPKPTTSAPVATSSPTTPPATPTGSPTDAPLTNAPTRPSTPTTPTTIPPTTPSPTTKAPTKTPSTAPGTTVPTATAQPFTSAPTKVPVVNPASESNSIVIATSIAAGTCVLLAGLVVVFVLGKKKRYAVSAKPVKTASAEDVPVAKVSGEKGSGGEDTDDFPYPQRPSKFPNDVPVNLTTIIMYNNDMPDDISTLESPTVLMQRGADEFSTSSPIGTRFVDVEEANTVQPTVATEPKSLLSVRESGDDDTSNNNIFENLDHQKFKQINVEIPPGDLGIALMDAGVPEVCSIQQDSILRDRVRVGDQLVAVDGVDVSESSRTDVLRLLHMNSNSTRQLTFIRPQND